MRFQLHWQNIKNPEQSVLVAEDEASDPKSCDKMMARFNAIIKEKAPECPEGWGPMVCDDTYDGWVWPDPKSEAGS